MVRLWPGRPDREEWPGFLLFMGVVTLLFAVYWAWTAAIDGSVVRAGLAVGWAVLAGNFLVRWKRARQPRKQSSL